MQSAQKASSNTEYGSTIDIGEFSTRRFALPIDDFVQLANGGVVKMKVVHIDSYTVSSFGSRVSGMRTINTKFEPFLSKLAAEGATE
jgi:hypothetical protein